MGEGFGQWFFFMYLCIQEKRAVSLSIVRQNGSHKSVKKLLHFCYTTTWTNQLGSCYTTKYERVVHFPLSPRKVLWNLVQRKSKKNVSIVTSMSYDTFLLYIIVLPEYVESTQILPKDSPMATIWLHFFLQNKNLLLSGKSFTRQ